jgi:hypothetical protein
MFDLRRATVPALTATALMAIGVLSFVGSRLRWLPAGGLIKATPALVSGDEPHYFLTTTSLLLDGDLQMADDYRAVYRGSLRAGLRMPRRPLDHHTILYDRASGKTALWQDVFDRHHFSRCGPGCFTWPLRTQPFGDPATVAELPAHPVAFPALIAAALYPFQLEEQQLEPHAIDVVLALSWLGVLATYGCARRAGFHRGWALLASGLCGLASPWLAYSRSLFTETALGLCLALSLYALTARRPVLSGLAAGVALAIKPAFALAAAGFALERLLARRPREAALLLAPVALLGLATLAFDYHLAHRLIAGPLGWEGADGPAGIFIMLLDNRHGLITFAPWTALGLYATFASLGRAQPAWADESATLLLRRIAFGSAGYLLMVAATSWPEGGYCYGPRYWVALLPWLSLAAVALARGAGRKTRIALLVLGALGLLIAVPGTLRYAELFDRPVIAAFKS